MIRQHRRYLRAFSAVVLGPSAVAVFAGAELHPYGLTAEAVGASVTFLVAQAAVLSWSRYRLWRARRRLAAFRASRHS